MQYNLKDTVILAQDISVDIQGKTIIKDITFVEKDVERPNQITGQVLAFVGRSGRGKSTLFKVLTGLLSPTKGKVLIRDEKGQSDNNSISAKTVQEGDVGFVNQKYTLFRHKTVQQALFYALRNSDLSAEEKKQKIEQYLTEWGLEKVRNSYPNELSGGQKQRVAIIEQIISSGHYIVLDEPFSGLDIGNIEDVKESIALITCSDTLNTILFSTHDIELAVEIADSIYIIGYPTENGQKMDYGTIMAHIDLKERGLAWEAFDNRHIELVKEIRDIMLNS